MMIKSMINTIICGECAEIMSEGLPEKCVDLVVTSPPYGSIRAYEGFIFNFEKIARELFRILKDGAVIVWVVGDERQNGSESGESFKQALFFKDLGLNLHDTMIYEKNGASCPSKDVYYQIFEYMFVFSKGKPKTINLLSDRKNLWGKSWGIRSRRDAQGRLIKGDRISGGDFGVRFNVWRYNTGKGYSTKDEIAFQHPAIFPEQLAADHIKTWSNKGDLVLDPMNGSGTTIKMAKLLDRRFIGIDVSAKYCEIARKRLAQEILF